MTVCANCKTTQGPFYTTWSDYNIPICKPIKGQQTRITKCVETRAKIDAENYKDQMHPYA